MPQRTCVGCRQVLPKRTLVRIVRTPAAVQVDPTGKLAGRGAYLHNQRACWARGLKGALASALRCELTETDRRTLADFMGSLPEDEPDPEQMDREAARLDKKSGGAPDPDP